jgi:hypothetical protein
MGRVVGTCVLVIYDVSGEVPVLYPVLSISDVALVEPCLYSSIFYPLNMQDDSPGRVSP